LSYKVLAILGGSELIDMRRRMLRERLEGNFFPGQFDEVLAISGIRSPCEEAAEGAQREKITNFDI
jgi:hypothetical protein